MDEVEILRAAHPGWSVRRRQDGLLECATGKYTLVAWGAASAGKGIAEWEAQTGTAGPGMTSDEFLAKVGGGLTGAEPRLKGDPS